MKAFVLCLAFMGSFVHAETRCSAEASQAVTQQAEKDFPGKNIMVAMPDMNNMGEVSVDTYVVDAIDMDTTAVLGRYKLMVDETCHVISLPTPTF